MISHASKIRRMARYRATKILRERHAEEFADLIASETKAIVDELQQERYDSFATADIETENG